MDPMSMMEAARGRIRSSPVPGGSREWNWRLNLVDTDVLLAVATLLEETETTEKP